MTNLTKYLFSKKKNCFWNKWLNYTAIINVAYYEQSVETVWTPRGLQLNVTHIPGNTLLQLTLKITLKLSIFSLRFFYHSKNSPSYEYWHSKYIRINEIRNAESAYIARRHALPLPIAAALNFKKGKWHANWMCDIFLQNVRSIRTNKVHISSSNTLIHCSRVHICTLHHIHGRKENTIGVEVLQGIKHRF